MFIKDGEVYLVPFTWPETLVYVFSFDHIEFKLNLKILSGGSFTQLVLDLHFRELWVDEINLGILVIWMVIKVIGMIGCYQLVRMKVCEKNWALGFTFKF